MRGKGYSRGWRGWMTAFVISLATCVQAHDPGLSTVTLKLFSDRLEADAIFARADIETLVPLDTDHDGQVSPQEWERARPQLETLSRQALSVLINGNAVPLTKSGFHLDQNNNFEISGIFPAHDAKALTIESALINQLARGHRQFLNLLDERGEPLVEELLSANHNVLELNLPNRLADGVEPAKTTTFPQFFFMGVEHILTGYDHLLFLFGLLIAMAQFRATVWVITCFTLAHSTTLALAAFDVVRIPGRIVEPLIAATIIYVGVENLLRSGGPTGRWRLTLIFGVVHGLGFATELKEKLAGMIGAKIAVPLVSFNLGVEAGQMAVAALVLPIIWWLRAEPAFKRRSMPVCSALVVLAGAWWLLERTLPV